MSYERDYQVCGITLPDEAFGMFDTGDVLRYARIGVVLVALMIAAAAAWYFYPTPAKASDTARSQASAEVDFLSAHNASSAELCKAYSKLADADVAAQSPQYNNDRFYRRIYCDAAAQLS